MKNTFFQSAKQIGLGLLLSAALIPAAQAVHAANVKTPPAVKPSAPYVSAEAEQTVSDDFPGARNIQWGNDAPDVYTAYFTQAGIKNVANVDDDGQLLSVLTYFTAARTPGRIRNLLAEKYPDMRLQGVVRYDMEDGELPDVTYEATLEDASHWYIVTVNGKDVHTKQVLNKS